MSFTISNKSIKISDKGIVLLKKHALKTRFKNTQLVQVARELKNWIFKSNHDQGKISNKNINDLIIIFRHVYISADSARFPHKSRPEGFTHLACLQNLVETILQSKYFSKVKLHILYNGNQDEFSSDKVAIFLAESEVHAMVTLVEARSAVESALAMLESIEDLSKNNDDLIYILENDYIHAPNWIEEVVEVYSSDINFDYISLYDHPDRYKLHSNYKNSNLYVTNTRHWISAPSTCGTFLFKRSVYKRDFRWLFSTHNDHQMFKRLTGKLKRKLITPVPGLAVHCMNDHLDPIQKFEKKYFNGHEKHNCV
jgi:hypothetical protein